MPMQYVDPVIVYFKSLQDSICDQLVQMDMDISEQVDSWERAEGGGGTSRVFTRGQIIEKGGVNFSHVYGNSLPPSATQRKPELANKPFQAMGVSVVLHPENPFIPTTHMNVRFFCTVPSNPEEEPIWWFGGGFDLTPYYPFEEDAILWHERAKTSCSGFGMELYEQFKENCDTYFFLPHRNEQRGVGGLFFDDFNELGFEQSFAMVISVGNAFFPTWKEIADKRSGTSFNKEQKAFQLYRRGRYVEFNLLYDRGTLFGLQSNGRTESILMSLPPTVKWEYQYTPTPDSPEDKLTKEFLIKRKWI